ncbi:MULTISPECIES: PAS domain S-box protein [unclassified Streptomyces]|uniref:PAS domain S-box protein n=1 Tax=Streptomyces TaxID=1883 RepID=UPI0001C18E07|nr:MULTISPECIES: PAS domain S-box protein [unclassified Streptomyces]MYR66563.1 PAS domain-containing protein [Streptomyces sp. SID4939]MYR99598.1 PAS domain-containing protein [Streptomyces sp. SID4940]MYT61801.1 PAS domain-containing protein [Streptomyces sp. SID8357]MYT85171.1 PAS domain-containing protein [Streptomyces sp. SID8360]MYU32417.1 PAS domain-containing protein [Streptomyces sp. SID8358]MYW39134.1 PAS domain-containing protein [Streptomyces sp. SID1]
MSASRSSGVADAIGPEEGPGPEGAVLLAALLDGMDAALCAFDAGGTVTHWNREAERILGWSAAEAVGRRGFAGWAVRSADAEDVQRRLMSAMDAPGRQVHEFALLRKDGGRVLVRTQSSGVRGPDGAPAGVYCAFSEVHAQIDLERSIALSEALLDDASWGVVLVDVDLRPTVVNSYAARTLGAGRTALLGRPLGELIVQGVEELQGALQHVLAEGAPPAPAELWVTVRTAEGDRRRCWRSGFLRLVSPLAEEPVPLGVGWLFRDVTEAKLAEQEADRLRFRSNQLHRAARQAAECQDPMEAATSSLDYALAGFADHVLVDVFAGERLVRAAATPSDAPGPCLPVSGGSIPVRYAAGHPALQAVERTGAVRTSARAGAGETWALERQWPGDAVHALCVVLRSRGRTLGVVTFLRAANRSAFERPDALYAESVAARVASAVDLAQLTGRDAL